MQTSLSKVSLRKGIYTSNDIILGNDLIRSNVKFMSFFHNFHSPPYYYANGIKYINDYDLEEYKP